MGLYSRSSSDGRHRKGTHGSGHYQQKGLLGNLMNGMGSESGSGGHSYRRENHRAQPASGRHGAYENQNSLTCSKCRARIPAGAKFCLQCGEKVTDALFCTSCGEKLPIDAKFCPKCGSKLNG